jgi:hypothetical protein
MLFTLLVGARDPAAGRTSWPEKSDLFQALGFYGVNVISQRLLGSAGGSKRTSRTISAQAFRSRACDTGRPQLSRVKASADFGESEQAFFRTSSAL